MFSSSTSEREGHGEVDVAFLDVPSHAFGHQHDADQQEEGQGEDLDGRVALHETAHRVHRDKHDEHGDDHGHHHDRHLIGHPDGGDDRVERKDDVEHEDLGEHPGEAGAPLTRRLGARVPSLDLGVDLADRLDDQEEPATEEDQIAP